MPELPEVEVIKTALHASVSGQKLKQFHIKFPRLRYPIDCVDLKGTSDVVLKSITRHSKYMVWDFTDVQYLLHLGMSGSVRICSEHDPWKKHEHIQWVFEHTTLRLTDPRRFGLWVELTENWDIKLQRYGPDALNNWDVSLWYHTHQHSQRGIYKLLMDQHILSGVGNIYAQEALFQSNIHPLTILKHLTEKQIIHLGSILQTILKKAILSGGTTLNDHRTLDGSSGYFQISLLVYGRSGENCYNCQGVITSLKISQRTIALCENCQTLSI